MLGNYSDSFPVNAPWRLTFGWDDEDGVPIDLSALLANAIRMQVQLEDGSILEYDLDTGITLTPLVVNAAAVDVAFQADNLVRSTVAKFFSAGASDNQTVVLSAGSNAGTYLVDAAPPDGLLTIDDQAALPVKNLDGSAVVFTPEAGAGTVTITDLSRFDLDVDPGLAESTNFYDLWIDLLGANPVLKGSITVTRSNEI